MDGDELSYLTKVLGTSARDLQVLAALIQPNISRLEDKTLLEEARELRSGISRIEEQIKNLTKENEAMTSKLQLARSDGSNLTSKVDALETLLSNLEIAWNSKKSSKDRWTLRRK